MKNIIGIMASTKEGIIGYNNTLPWNYSDELEHFNNTTRNHIIIMGRKTYESIPKNLLKDRQAIVLSKNISLYLDDAIIFYNLEPCLNYIENYIGNRKFFMIGGGEIASLFLENNIISSFILTEIQKSYSGNVYITPRYFHVWNKEILKKTENYIIYLLTNPEKVL